MANIVLLPQIGISEESAVLATWHVKVGDTVKVGDFLFSLETGKASFDVESEFAGTVLALFCEQGDEIAVSVPVCALGQPGEKFDVEALLPSTPPGGSTNLASGGAQSTPSAVVASPATAVPTVESAPVARVSGGQAGGVSPRAKMLAAKNDVDFTLAAPTGPNGRVIERDVRALIDSGAAIAAAFGTASQPEKSSELKSSAASEYEDKPLTTIRKAIAKNMMESLQNTAQLTHTHSFDATAIQNYRNLVKKSEDLAGITIGDMILFAVTRTLPAFPDFNSWFMGDSMRTFGAVNLAVAVDTEKGLMVPVIFGASEMSLLEISKELKILADACRKGSISPKQLSGGSFTVSNLGNLGVESFTPILNPPQVGILGVNTITTRVREVGGEIKTYPAMTLSLTYDHRAVDGAPASRFLNALCKNLENFTALLAR